MINEQKSRATRPAGWLPYAASIVSFVPLVWQWRHFKRLFWFGDEWDQLDHISHHGFWHWVFECFGENFAPLLKMSWGGLALTTHGSYALMLVSVWCIHAGCVLLLGKWLLDAGFGATATALVLLVFGLTATNLETLGWTIQLITIQGIFFFLAAAWWRQRAERHERTSAGTLALVGLITASTFSFVRGPLTGGSLAVASLLGRGPISRPLSRRLLTAAWCLLPAFLAAGIVMAYAPGNHHHLAQAGFKAPGLFAAGYFFLNPFYNFTATWGWTERTIVVFGAVKLAVLVGGALCANRSQRGVLITLLAFDVGNALLMGIGRYNEWLITATSSRYQYVSLLCTLPYVGILLESGLLRLAPAVRLACGTLVFASATFVSLRAWPRDLPGWAQHRGDAGRAVLTSSGGAPATVPGNPAMRPERARDLAKEFNLH